MDVIARGIKKGFKLKYKRRVHRILYPDKIWESTPRRTRRFVTENAAFLATSHIPLVLRAGRFTYNTAMPAFMKHYGRLFRSYLPFVADSDGIPAAELLGHFSKTKYRFSGKSSAMAELSSDLQDRAVISFTFGKDSLLSYCVADELGLEPVPVYVEEPEIGKQYENMHKNVLIDKFGKEFGRKTLSYRNEAGLLRYYDYLNVKKTELGWCQQLTEYFIEMLPICNSMGARFILFGNEHSCSDFYYNKAGHKCYPVYDQSADWMLSMGRMARKVDKRLAVLSLVEPLHEIAITKVLHSRYRDHAKYQTSCFAEKKSGSLSRWCHYCTKCSRMYAFMKANGIDPQTVGFSRNLFDRQFLNYYTIFRNGSKVRDSVPYDNTGLGRDEQLFAFYLAAKNGARGYLINRFRKEHLPEVRAREDELHRNFFRVNRSITIPKELRKDVYSIYREELES